MSSKSTVNSVFFRYSPSDTAITRKNFESFFSDIGPVKKCSLIRQEKTESNDKRRDAKGYGFCKFTCREDAIDAAEKLNEKTMELEYGMKVKVWVEVADKGATIKEKHNSLKIPEGTPTHDSTSIPTEELLQLQSKKRDSRVILRNLSFYATENNIRQAMQEKFGEVIEINLPLVPMQDSKGKNKFQHRGFAFVTFANQSSANEAVEMSASDKKVVIKNRPVSIEFSVPKIQHQRLKEEAKNNEEQETEDHKMGADLDDASQNSGSEVESVGVDDASQTASESNSEVNSNDGLDGEIGVNIADSSTNPLENKNSLFLRNLPFDATRHDLFMLFKQFGRIEAVFLVKDRETGINKGTAFVKFGNEGGCVRALEACNAASEQEDGFKSGKTIMSEGETTAGGIYLNGRRILVDLAVDKNTADTLKVERDEDGKPIDKVGKDKRNLYLKGEGRVETSDDKNDPNSWDNLPQSDQLKRGRAHQEKSTKLRSPLFFINPFRLSIRNLAKHVDEKGLKELMVKGIKNGISNNLVSKEDVIAHYRATGEMTKRQIIDKITNMEKDGNLIPPFDEKSIKAFIPSVFIDRDFSSLKESESSKGSKLVAPSRGFGFVEFTHHVHAIACLRELNNNAAYSLEYVAGGKKAFEMKKLSRKGKKTRVIDKDLEEGGSGSNFVDGSGVVRMPRLIIEFTVENRAKARKQAERKAQQLANVQKQKEVAKDSKKDSAGEETKKSSKHRGAMQRDRKRKAKEANSSDHEIKTNMSEAKKQRTQGLDETAEEPKIKLKPLKPQKKVKKSDTEENVFENLVQSYKKTFAAGVADSVVLKPLENPRAEVTKKRWFD